MSLKHPVVAVLAVLMLTASPAAAVPELPSDEQRDEEEALAQFRAAVEEMRATLLRPGDRVEGWDVGGADPDSDLRARGSDRHYYLSSGGLNGTSVGILTDRPILDFVPAGWQVVDSYGSGVGPLTGAEVGFQALSPRYVIGGRSQIRRVNDVDCFTGMTDALLFEVPGAAARADDELMPIFFRMAVLAMEDQTICIRSEGDTERGYRFRYFLPDGRALPEMTDLNEITRIVPASPIDQLIVPPPPLPVEADNGTTTS